MGRGTGFRLGLGGMAIAAGLWLLPALLGVMVFDRPLALAQTCPYATLRLETTRPLDAAAICEAAQPWAAAQYELLIYVTDLRPDSEESWFAQVDQVEIGVGLRQAGPEDRFRVRGFTLAMTTATDLPYAIALTRGEALGNTPLGSSPPARDAVRQRMRGLLAAQDGTGAIVLGLRELGQLANLGGETSLPVDGGDGANLGTLLQTLLAVLGNGVVLTGAAGAGLLGWWRSRWLRGCRTYLGQIRDRVANLLMGCDGALNAGPVELMTAYLAFGAAGGGAYPDRDQRVRQDLTQARQLLDRAFQTYGTLQETQPSTPTLKDQIRDWERLYLALMGNDPAVTSLDDRALQDLLTPSRWSGDDQASTQSPGPMTQLEAQQTVGTGAKLRIELLNAPEEPPTLGVMGHLARVQGVVIQLQQARARAPQRLAAVQQARPSWERLIPESLGVPPGVALAGVDQEIAAAVTALAQGLSLGVMDRCDRVDQAIAALTPLAPTLTQGEDTLDQVAHLQAQGYHPPTLPPLERQIQILHTTLGDLLGRSQYEALGEPLAQWQRLTGEALTSIQRWQALQQDNATQLTKLGQTCDRLRRRVEGEMAPVWQTLQTYPRSNWYALVTVVAAVSDRLHRAETVTLPDLHQRNSLAVQDFAGVERDWVALGEEFRAIEGQCEQVLGRYQRVIWVQNNLVREVAEIRNYLRQTQDLVQAKFLGLVAMGPGDSRLAQAEGCLAAAEANFQRREYFQAGEQQDEGLRWVLRVYREKVEAQGEDMRPLTTQAGVSMGRSRFLEAMADLPTAQTIDETQDLALFQLFHRLTAIRQELQVARRRCKEEARNYQASSSSSSSWSSSSSDYGSSSSGWGSSSSDSGSSGGDWGSSSRD